MWVINVVMEAMEVNYCSLQPLSPREERLPAESEDDRGFRGMSAM